VNGGRAPRVVALILLTGAVLASGCSSGDDDAAPDATTTTAPADRAAGDATTTTTTTGGDGADDDSPSGDGCDLVSDEVASAVLGIDIDRREPHEDAAGQSVSCIKGTERQADVTQASYVSVSVYPASVGAALMEGAVDEGATSVEGLGDEAAFLATAGLLIVLYGDDAVHVQVVKNGVPAGLDDATTVAADVLDRLS